jgi:hypothetical protein
MTCDIPDTAQSRKSALACGAHSFFDQTGEFERVRATIKQIACERWARATLERGAHDV